MFPSLAARETYVAEANFAVRKTKNVFACSQKHLLLSGHKFCVRNMFPTLATLGNITRNIVSAKMFPSLARPLLNCTPQRSLINNETTSTSFLRADSQRGAAELTIARRKRGQVV